MAALASRVRRDSAKVWMCWTRLTWILVPEVGRQWGPKWLQFSHPQLHIVAEHLSIFMVVAGNLKEMTGIQSVESLRQFAKLVSWRRNGEPDGKLLMDVGVKRHDGCWFNLWRMRLFGLIKLLVDCEQCSCTWSINVVVVQKQFLSSEHQRQRSSNWNWFISGSWEGMTGLRRCTILLLWQGSEWFLKPCCLQPMAWRFGAKPWHGQGVLWCSGSLAHKAGLSYQCLVGCWWRIDRWFAADDDNDIAGCRCSMVECITCWATLPIQSELVNSMLLITSVKSKERVGGPIDIHLTCAFVDTVPGCVTPSLWPACLWSVTCLTEAVWQWVANSCPGLLIFSDC